MPPKQKGHNARGRKKIFRHAVENVRIGVGHTALGSISLQLAAGVPTPEAQDGAESAFFLELNQQLLSHSSKDFTRFRWEVLEMCETRPILLLHHREVAEALLQRLMDRSAGVFTGRSSVAKARGDTQRGLTSEGYDAFLRLTIAFARDLQEKFLPYFEVFHQAVHAGLFDSHGNVIASADRLQLLYSVQAVWCREMLPFWEVAEHQRILRRIIRLYIRQMRDQKEYVRRLSAELLAFLCRLCRRCVLPVVVTEAAREVVADFAASESGSAGPPSNSSSSSSESDADDDEDEESVEKDLDQSDAEDIDRAPPALSRRSVWTGAPLEAFVRNSLPLHPIADGLAFFAADLLRGMQGTLSSSMEFFYTHLMQSFGLTAAAVPVTELLDGVAVAQAEPAEEAALRLLREMGATVLGEALAVVFIETRKQSAKALEDDEDPSASDADEDAEARRASAVDRPSHRLLAVVVELLQPDVYHVRILDQLLKAGNHFLWRDKLESPLLLRVAKTLRQRVEEIQGAGARQHETLAYCSAVLEVLLALCVAPYVTGEMDYGKPQVGSGVERAVEVQKIFLGVGKQAVDALATHALSDTAVGDAEAAQVALLAFAQDVLAKNYSFCLAAEHRRNEMREAEGLGTDGSREDDAAGRKSKYGALKSFLTPLGLTLLRSMAMSWWSAAVATAAQPPSERRRRLLERAVLLVRAMSDATQHTKSTPLQQIMRLRPMGHREKVESQQAAPPQSPVPRLLQELFLVIARSFLDRGAANGSQGSEPLHDVYAELFICTLPLSYDVFHAQPAADTVDQWLSLLLEVQRRAAPEEAGSSSYLVHAHVSLCLLQLSADGCGGSDTAWRAEAQEASVRHLSRTIDLLYEGFTQVAAQSADSSGGQLPPSGSSRCQLYRAAEILLEALDVAVRADGQRKRGASDAADLLKDLPTVAQERLAAVLLEALPAPLQSLRVAALQLLHVLCHPTQVPASRRLAGLDAVDPNIFSALTAAECYNPLSHSGNVDGLRRALNPVVAAAERRHVEGALSKIIVGRAMVGLFHLKFAEAWSIAIRVLSELCRAEEAEAEAEAPRSFPVWNAVLQRYARLLVVGEAAEERGGAAVGAAALPPPSHHHFPLYRIRLTDQQRHERGDMVSRAFSAALRRQSRYVVVDLPSQDGEVLSWDEHWRRAHLSAAAVRSAASGGATDEATVAKTFLRAVSAVLQHVGQAADPRLVLVEHLTKELAAVYHHEHPSGQQVSLKRIEERVELALQACCSGPSIAVTRSDHRRLQPEEAGQLSIEQRGEEMGSIASAFLADGNSRLQKAAVDYLKRLKVPPFSTYYQHIAPFTESMKSIFSFLSSFHMETAVVEADRPSYLAAVLTITLPKLMAKVSKEKRKDQAVLQRRVLGFLQLLPAGTLSSVVAQLLQRLVFARAQELGGWEVAERDVEFVRQWKEKISRGERQAGRFVERLHKRLYAALRLLEALINAVGADFGPCVKTCAFVAIQSYLVACRQPLLEPVERQLQLRDGADAAFLQRLQQQLCSKAFASLASHVRRSAVQVVALLTEQFPVELMEAVRDDLSHRRCTVRASPFGAYVAQLYLHSRGVTRDAEASRADKSATKGYTTPVLRLIRGWLMGPTMLPLLPAFAEEVTGTLQEVFAVSARPVMEGRANRVYRAPTATIREALSCVTDILRLAEEEVESLGGEDQDRGTAGTLQALYIVPSFCTIFESIYRLIVRGAERGDSGPTARTVMSFPPQLWRELFHTVTALSSLARLASVEMGPQQRQMPEMQGRLLEIAIRFTSHPVCVNDSTTLVQALEELHRLVEVRLELDLERHYYPLLHLFNALPTPAARLQLCAIFQVAVTKLLPLYQTAAPQLDAVARAVQCLNSFDEENNALDRYDFDLRFHTFHSLSKFFLNSGNYGALSAGSVSSAAAGEPGEMAGAPQNQVRRERDYSGALDVRLPLDKKAYPQLTLEGFAALAANIMFFLRDSESTIRTFARHVLQAMMRYATAAPNGAAYRQRVLETVVRRFVLPSLRRGVVARDVHIRGEHMCAIGALGKHMGAEFPSFGLLHAPNSEENFFLNVCHVQPKARLNALALLRSRAKSLQVRDLLRVFIPFLMSAVKDFAQGKRDLQNLTEGKAKGYCDAVLTTIASISQHLPWVAYHRVLTMLLSNASANADLRLPMLRGVVQVLNHFHFLDEDRTLQAADVTIAGQGEDWEDDDVDQDDGAAVRAGTKQQGEYFSVPSGEGGRQYYRQRIIQSLEREILPQLLEFICDSKTRRGLGLQDGLAGQHNISSIRRDEQKKSKGATKNSIIQLPVAIAVTKIVKKLPEERCNEYMDMLLDEVISKLRTKNDKQRDSARRILGVMLQETGPGKLKYVMRKLKGHLVHGYQLHVLGYTVVTLLYQLYEPNNQLLQENAHHQHVTGVSSSASRGGADVVQEALDLVARAEAQERRRERDGRREEVNPSEEGTDQGERPANDASEAVIRLAEEELIRQLVPVSARFDPEFGVACLTEVLDELLMIFLDDYLGEIGHQKEQIELMSKMVEVKRNRSTQGFCLLARHAKADVMLEAFLKRISWVLTPPSESEALVLGQNAGGSAHVRTLIRAEIQKKYTTVGKAASADIVFVRKVRTLSLSVARNFLVNATLEVDHALEQVRTRLGQHNQVREDRIRAFEAKDGTRRVRGNAHLVIHAAPRQTLRDQADKNFLVCPEPERVDADFSAHTVLTTQQKQKLRSYKGRYARELQQASKDFYREDATTAVVLDTLDEFLLRLLLSVLRKVLGIGREKKRRSAVELDLLRRRRRRDEAEEEEEEEEEESSDTSVQEEEEEGLNPSAINEDVDDLEHFAAAASEAITPARRDGKAGAPTADPLLDLNAAFTQEHRELLESLLIVVLTTLEGEGSDAVVAHALDTVLALVSLRPPLDVEAHTSRLIETVSTYFERGGPIKQRALRVCAGIISHQRCALSLEEAKRMVLLIRGEVMDRTEHLPMALSLLYAILGKHVQLVEIYDLVDLLTELLVHLSGKRFIRSRCILSVVRFLTEYKLTPSKFRSHIDQLCRNLDYPELGGRLALLDLMDALMVRLPTVVLRQEAPVLFLPLAAMTSHGELPKDRQRAGDVLQTLVRHAGVDVVAPTLQGWLAPTSDRPTRTMAVQVLALCAASLRAAYGEADADEETAGAFEASVAWCLPALLEACRFDPLAARPATSPRGGAARLKGWSLVFYALRALESIALTAPERIYPALAPPLVPLLAERLVSHPHAWVRGVSLRLLNHYCYTFVERRCGYLSDALPTANDTAAALPLVLDSAQQAPQLAAALLALLKRLLTLVGESDIEKEKHDANFAIDRPARAELLRCMIYSVKAAQQCCLAHLVAEEQRGPAREFVSQQFRRLHRHIAAVASPALKQSTVVHYVVRTATLAQFFGGYVGVLPRGGGGGGGGGTGAEKEYTAACCWLLTEGTHILDLVRDVAAPLLNMGIASNTLSHRLSEVSFQSLKVVQQQLEDRRGLFVVHDSSAVACGKRRRSDAAAGLDEVLAVLVEKESARHDERKAQRIKTEVRKAQRRSAREQLPTPAAGKKRSRHEAH